MSGTRAQQQKTVGQGLALGAVMLGVGEVNGDKLDLEFGFRTAWRAWDDAYRFPGIRTGPTQDDILGILHDSANRRGPNIALWLDEWPFRPTVRVDWEPHEIAEIIHPNVSAESWRDLTEGWLRQADA